MQILIDGTPSEHTAETASEAMQIVRAWAADRQRVVTGIELDGTRLEGDQIAQLDAIEGGGALAATTSLPGDLVAEAFRDAAGVLLQTRSDQSAAADLIDEGQVEQAMQHLSVCMGAWNASRQVLDQGLTLLDRSIDDVFVTNGQGDRVSAGGESGCVEALVGTLRELKRALEDQDFATVSDLLRFDLEEQTKQWEQLFLGTADGVSST